MTHYDRVKQIHHLAEVLYDTTRYYDILNRTRADIIQDIIDEMQEHLDECLNDLKRVEEQD